MVLRDAEAAEERLETCLRHDVAGQGIVDVLLPVDQCRSGDVAQVVVRRRVVVDLDDPDLRVSEVALHPARVDQDFGMCVSCYGPSPCPFEVLRCYIPCAYRYSYPHVEAGILAADRLFSAASRTATFTRYVQLAGS